MKIAYISTLRNVPWGGSEELWFQSAKEAMKDGHTVAVFTYDWPQLPAAMRELEGNGATIFRRPHSIPLTRRVFQKVLTRFGKDVYKMNGLNPYKDLLSFKPDRIVVTDGGTYYAADDHWLREFLIDHFDGKYVLISQGNSPAHQPADRSHALNFFKKAKELVFVSENNRQLTFHQLAEKLNNTILVQNPVNMDQFKALPFPPVVNGQVHCAMVGRLCIGDKGQDIVISMMAEPFWKNSSLTIHIYGNGNDKEYIKDLIQFYRVEDKVKLEGFTSMHEIWNTCHCLLMPSHIEGTPLTLLEAMVLGRVCIVTDVGGNAEWIKDNENGFLVEAPTRALFSDKLKEAVNRLNEWPAIAASAHASAMEKLDEVPGKSLLKEVVS